MPGGLGPRFLIEAGFLIAVAVAAGLARLDAIWIIVLMAGAWLLMATIEWGISRVRSRPAGEAAPAPASGAEPALVPESVTVVAAPAPTPVGPAAAERSDPEPEPAPEPDVTPGPSPEPAPEAEPEPPSEPAPSEAPPEQPRVAVAPVPVPEPVAEPATPVEEPRVVALTPRSLGVPQRWNLWELERVAREQSGSDAIRDEERSFLLMYLREFADADGVLPTSFDGVVREAFGDALDAVRA